MQRDINDRLSRLRARRSEGGSTSFAMQFDETEAFEKRTNDKATKYALGAMQEVAPRSTEISHEEAQRVINPLKQQLGGLGLYPTFELQGSVPINVHIRNASDVDILVVEERYLTYAAHGQKANTYWPYTFSTSVETELLTFRGRAERILKNHFWAATVDTTGAKSIQLSGGSLRRKVDVVPSYWFDSIDFQATGDTMHRGVYVVERDTETSILNYPFLYMSKIREKARATANGALMAVRLSKSVKNDSDTDIKLSSYDIGSLFFHCPSHMIYHQPARDLQILSGADAWLSSLASNRASAESFQTPDGTRKIIDSQEKWDGLVRLSRDVSSLAREVERELRSSFEFDAPIDDVRRRLNDRAIPLASERFF